MKVLSEKLNQPLLIEIVEESFDVCLEHVVYVLCPNRLVNEPNDIVSATPWPEPKGTVKESWLVDFVQHIRHDVLNQFVFVRGNTQRPLLAIGFRNVRTPHRFGYVLEELHPVH